MKQIFDYIKTRVKNRSSTTLGLFIVLCFLIIGCTKKEEAIEILSPTEIFQTGSPIPLEVLYFEPKGANGSGSFYLSELTMTTENYATIAFKDLQSGNRLTQRLAISEEGISFEGKEPSNTEFNDFLFQNYSEWCGKWRGRRRNWRFCTGLDCGKGLAVCIQWQ